MGCIATSRSRFANPPNRARDWKVALALAILLPAAFCSLPAGCVELGIIPPPDNGGGDPPGNNNGNDNTDDENMPRVRLTASNLTPQVDEEVTLRCVLTNEAPEPIVYEFQAAGGPIGRVQVDELRGTATFIVQQPDIGVAVSVTCTGTNEFGEGPPSTAQVIVATSPEPPVPPNPEP
jgi:hypothetical protein